MSDGFSIPLHGIAVSWAVCFAAAVLWRKIRAGSFYAALLVVLTAMLVTALHTPNRALPYSEELLFTGMVKGLPEVRGSRLEAAVRIDRFRPDSGGAWKNSGEKILLSADTADARKINPGSRLICRGYINPFVRSDTVADARAESYAALMRRRGFTGRMWAGYGSEITPYGTSSFGLSALAARIRSAAAEKLSALPVSDRAKQVCLTMSLGLRSGLDRELREEYSRTGAAHLLAVSGLHVGIVALLANLLLGLLPLMRGGDRMKNILAIAAIWLYAVSSGLSPSTVRAAFMFTGAQAALAASEIRNSLNIMLGTAVIMLSLNPNMLFDISFQLSFAAVLGITVLYPPVYGRLRCRWKAVNMLTGAVVVSLAATLATGPLVSLRFGSLPLAGIVLSPLLMLTATVIIFTSVLRIAVPFDGLSGTLAWILQHTVDAQNALVGFCASKPWAALPLELSVWQTAAAYAVLLAGGIWLGLRPEQRKNEMSRI